MDKLFETLEELSKIPKKELDKQIMKIKQRLGEIQKQKMLEIRPKVLDKPRFEKIIKTCEKFIDELEEYGIDEEDDNGYWFELILEDIYGENVIDWIHKNYKR